MNTADVNAEEKIGAAMGAEWALNNQTYIYMNGWFDLTGHASEANPLLINQYEWEVISTRRHRGDTSHDARLPLVCCWRGRHTVPRDKVLKS